MSCLNLFRIPVSAPPPHVVCCCLFLSSLFLLYTPKHVENPSVRLFILSSIRPFFFHIPLLFLCLSFLRYSASHLFLHSFPVFPSFNFTITLPSFLCTLPLLNFRSFTLRVLLSFPLPSFIILISPFPTPSPFFFFIHLNILFSYMRLTSSPLTQPCTNPLLPHRHLIPHRRHNTHLRDAAPLSFASLSP